MGQVEAGDFATDDLDALLDGGVIHCEGDPDALVGVVPVLGCGAEEEGFAWNDEDAFLFEPEIDLF